MTNHVLMFQNLNIKREVYKILTKNSLHNFIQIGIKKMYI
jgi:hypothetical protein